MSREAARGRGQEMVGAVGAGLSLGAVFFWLAHIPRGEPEALLVAWSVACAGAAGWMAWGWKRGWGLGTLLCVGMALRLGIWGAGLVPGWSEDVLRYAWDGWLVVRGENPYALTPAVWSTTHETILARDGYANGLLVGMNSPSYHAVYPPIAQGLFALAEWVRAGWGGGLMSWLAVFRGGVVLAEGLVLWGLPRLLRRWGRDARWAWGYALHPLVLMEGTVNLHLEPLWTAALVVAGLAVTEGRRGWAGGSWAAAVGIKVVPVFLLPGVLGIARWRREFWWAAGALGLGLGGWFVWGSGPGMQGWAQSAALFFRTFEFHPGLYAPLRAAGTAWLGYNPIAWLGPALGLLGWCGAAAVALWGQRFHWGERFALGWGMILCTATTVHPWYFIPLFAAGLASRWIAPWVAATTAAVSYVRYVVVIPGEALRAPDAAAWDGAWALSWGLVFLAVGWDLWRCRRPCLSGV